MPITRLALVALLVAAPAFSQAPNDPFPDPIEATEGVIVVGYTEFATLPDVDGEPARPMRLVNEPGSGRLFVNDMQGPVYTVSYDGRPENTVGSFYQDDVAGVQIGHLDVRGRCSMAEALGGRQCLV